MPQPPLRKTSLPQLFNPSAVDIRHPGKHGLVSWRHTDNLILSEHLARTLLEFRMLCQNPFELFLKKQNIDMQKSQGLNVGTKD